MRWIVRLLFALAALLLAAFAWLGIPATAAGLVAKDVCSGVFLAGRPQADVLAADVLPASPLLRLVHVSVDEGEQRVRGRMLWSAERIAMLLPGLGCVLDSTPALLQRVPDDPATSQAGADPQRRPHWLRDWERDQRASIRLTDLLFMRDGLDQRERYEPWGAVPRMLWGVDDVPAFAGSAPAEVPAGRRFRYLSATTNILSRLLRAQFDSDAAYWRYPSEALFVPIGARSAVLESDASGTFVASSYLWATPRDWARIGQVLLEDGLAGGRRVFAPGWQRFAGTPLPSDDPAAMGYGAHVWLPGAAGAAGCGPDHRLPPDNFLSTGHWGQLAAVMPSRDAVIVRLGMRLDRQAFDRCAFLRAVTQALPADVAALSGN